MFQITYSDRFRKHYKKLNDQEKKSIQTKTNAFYIQSVSSVSSRQKNSRYGRSIRIQREYGYSRYLVLRRRKTCRSYRYWSSRYFAELLKPSRLVGAMKRRPLYGANPGTARTGIRVFRSSILEEEEEVVTKKVDVYRPYQDREDVDDYGEKGRDFQTDLCRRSPPYVTTCDKTGDRRDRNR